MPARPNVGIFGFILFLEPNHRRTAVCAFRAHGLDARGGVKRRLCFRRRHGRHPRYRPRPPPGRPTPGTDELVLVVGGAGRVGTRLVTTLRSMGVATRVMTRDPFSDASKRLKSLGAEIVLGDVTDVDTKNLDDAVKGCTRVVACFGAQRVSKPTDVFWLFDERGGPNVTDANHPAAVNHRGVVALAIACAKTSTVKRFVRITGMSAGYHPFDFVCVALNLVLSMSIRYQRLGEISTRLLNDSGIEYAIVRPGNLMEQARPTNSVVIIGHNSAKQPAGKVSRDDVAECVLGAIFWESAKNATIGISGKPFPTGGVTTEMVWDPARGMHYRTVEMADEVFEGTDVHAMMGEMKPDTEPEGVVKYQPFVFMLAALLAGVFTGMSALVFALGKKMLAAVVGMA